MALFDRDQLPARSTLSRFLAALTPEPVAACARSFSIICSLAHSRPTNKPEGWWIEQETPGSCSTSTGRGKLPANAPYGVSALARRVLFTIIITPISFTSSPSNLQIFHEHHVATRNEVMEAQQEEDERKNSRLHQASAARAARFLGKGATGDPATSDSWWKEEPAGESAVLKPTGVLDESHGRRAVVGARLYVLPAASP